MSQQAMSGTDGWSLGRTGRELGIPVTTLRSWCERYDLGPTARTPGGHRRFGPQDVERLALMKSMVDDGTPASVAARASVAAGASDGRADPPSESTDPTDADGLPRDLRTTVFVPTLLEAARSLDTAGMRRLFARAFDAVGVAAAWDLVVVPGLRAIGQAWADGVLQIEHEHVASEVLAAELTRRATRATRPPGAPDRARPVLLASLDEHGLPLSALQAALTERGVEVRSLGPRMPMPRIQSAGRTVMPAALFLWASLALPAGAQREVRLPGGRPVLLGGPGWRRPGRRATTSLRDAADRLATAYRQPGWSPPEAS